MVVDRQKVKTSSEFKRYRLAGRLDVRAGRMVRQVGMESRNRQGSKLGRLVKRVEQQAHGRKTLVDLNIQDELTQRDRKHRDKYTGDNKRHLEVVETVTRTGEPDQGVT